MKNVLILVMSAQREPWGQLIDAQRATWDSVELPGCITLYYCGAPKGGRSMTIYSEHDEHLCNLGRRTLEAYQHAVTIPGWDYVARVHSSTYVHKQRLLERCQSLPDTGVVRGVVCDYKPGHPFMWGGGHYIYSRDTLTALVAGSDGWDHVAMEDVAQSELAVRLGMVLQQGESCAIDLDPQGYMCTVYGGKDTSFTFTDFADTKKLTDQYFFRVKHDPDRRVDVRIMNSLFQTL